MAMYEAFRITNFVQMNLRMNNVEDKIKQVIDKWNVTGGNAGGTIGGLSIAAESEEQKKAREEAEKKKAEEEAQRITAESLKKLEEEHKRKMDEFLLEQERKKQDDAKQEELDRLAEEKLLFELLYI